MGLFVALHNCFVLNSFFKVRIIFVSKGCVFQSALRCTIHYILIFSTSLRRGGFLKNFYLYETSYFHYQMLLFNVLSNLCSYHL